MQHQHPDPVRETNTAPYFQPKNISLDTRQGEQPLDMTEMSLREHLLAAQAAGQAHSSPQHNIDPLISALPYGMGTVDDHEMGHEGDEGEDGEGFRRGKHRELSSTKRAAQNRAAQRAFRQRKDGYIKKLEDQVHSFASLEEMSKQLQAENYDLRNYVLTLQTRILEFEGSYPPPPESLSTSGVLRRPLHVRQQQYHHHSHQQGQSTDEHQQSVATGPSTNGDVRLQPQDTPYCPQINRQDPMDPEETVQQPQTAVVAVQSEGHRTENHSGTKRALRPEDEVAYAIQAANAAYAASQAANTRLEEKLGEGDDAVRR